LSAIDEGTQVSLEDAGVLAAGLLEGPIEGFEDREEARGLRGWSGTGDEGLELFARPFPKECPLGPVVSLEDLQEPDGLGPVKLCRLDGEHGGDLLLGREAGHTLGHGDGEEGIGDEVGRLGGEPLQDLDAPLHPGFLLPQASGDGVDGEAFDAVEIVEDLELLPQSGAPGRVIEAEALDLGLDPGPGLLDDPGLLLPKRLQGEEPLEAIDEEELSSLLDDHQRMVAVCVRRGGRRLEELERDGGEGHLPQAHGRHPLFASAGRRERTWKVG
jgi:hypothetical protein